MTGRTKVLLALFTGAALVVLSAGAWWLHQVRESGQGCFSLGQEVGKGAGGSLTLVRLASRVCAHDTGRLDQFFDGAGHTFPFDLARPAQATRRVVEALPAAAQLPFLRGMLIQYGRQNAHRPLACLHFARQHPTLPLQDRAFGLANGMAWRTHGRLSAGVRMGQQLSGITRTMFFEELGFQHARRHLRESFPPGLERLRALPARDRCLGIHGFVRHQLIHDRRRTTAAELLAQAPSRCLNHALHGALRASQAANDTRLAAELSVLVTPAVRQRLFELEYLP